MHNSTNPSVGNWERKFYAVVEGPWRLPLRLDLVVRLAFVAAALAVTFVAVLVFLALVHLTVHGG